MAVTIGPQDRDGDFYLAASGGGFYWSKRELVELRDLLLREFPLGTRPVDFAGKNPAECGCMFVYGEGLRPCPTHDPIIQRKERRERIATAVLAGFAACPNNSLPEESTTLERVAVRWADDLIAALDEEA